ncbi:hypothetical protein MATL_G00165330 [Megalops atlanticus]|uniref:Dapper homolog 1 n=1 Tax=Megalops atlanticus TaxID=7932 RepID=A0A9D3T8D2_MEGAT|nr:hypothetical protein MATL_G00165330 [Megalops atlanticus]
MKQTAAVAEMPGSNECLLARDRRDCDVRSRERVEGEVDRLRARERLEATLAGLGELEYLRQRQEMLVTSVLRHQENPTFTGEEKVCGAVENYLSSEEKLLEENILLLRKQLNCLRRRDAGLISQLQELDRQISDLRLDTEKVSHDRLETDSRPSSGFYELSDGASGSLSNSSNSVFSECLSSCHSSTCFCSPLDASFSVSEGRPKSADDLLGCVECEGHCDEQSSAAVRRSFSAPYSPSIDSFSESQSKYHCDLIAKNGNDVYRYPSPLHAVAVQSPIFFQSLIGHLKEEGIPPKAEPLSSKCPYLPVLEDNKPTQPMKMGTPKKCPKSPPVNASAVEERPTLELMSVGSSSHSQDEGGQMVSAQYIPAHRQTVKLRKGSKNIKIVKVKSTMLKSRAHGEPALGAGWEKPRARIKKCHFPEDAHNLHKASRKTSSRAKRIPAVIPEGRVVDKHPPPLMFKTAAPRHHGHGREVVLTKPKYKRSDYRRLKSINEVPYEEAMRRAQRRQKREVLGQMSAMYLPDNAQYTSPYTYMGSDSEYSAECASLFHSTILDTSEDERSNYTTNCFGDSESSFSEVDFVGESSTTSDSEESAGVNWPQFGQAGTVLPQEMTAAQAKAFVKIKASHNLKKKILRFRSGSLKLMTTV